jgi:hypothetical protein
MAEVAAKSALGGCANALRPISVETSTRMIGLKNRFLK